MLDLDVIDDPAAATALLDPARGRILAELAEPGSATTVAAALGEPRQRVNYHLRTLEQHGLVRLVEERPRRGLRERIVQASARSYVLSPAVLGANAAEPDRTDRHSTRYLIAVAARLVREVAELAEAVRTLAGRYHDETAPGGRWHRLVVAAHPRPNRAPARAEER